MRRTRVFVTLALAVVPALFSVGAGPQEKPLSVLFLGDKGHHRPADRAAQLAPVMNDRGIRVTYTEDVGDLNPETLAKYDALIVYANIDAIEPAREKALLDYVAGGGGFVPLHCASYCFRNSEEYVKLVGAQFKSHGTGEFETRVVDPSHPITKGLEPFTTWDETYVHSRHNEADRHVLQTRAEGNAEEPWTWVRTHGKGRVFYTAYGHDGRTFGLPGFHDLIERGVRWAANRGEVVDHHPRASAGLKPFRYMDPKSPIPQYLAGKKWGVQGAPINTMQEPLPPGESVKHMVLPRGFEAKLFASEPEIGKPLCMAWDHRGRLWVAESTDYPNNLKAVGTGDDRIKICEDTDGDGRADKFTVFADKLSIPTSIAFADGGVIVHDAPDTLFLRDTDGDDRADERKVLFTGWGTRDTHAGPSNLRWGFDNWLYGMVGYSGFDGKVGGESLKFSQGFYRFKPDGSKLEFLRSTNNNTWGLGLSEEGIVFGSTANNTPSVYLPIPNRYYESVRGWSPSVLASIAGWNRFFPVTDKVRQVDWHGGFTAAAGHALYTARAYPKHYWNRTAFVTEPTGHLVATFLLEPDGSDFGSDNTWNLLASDDEWTSPIMAEVGPDGHVWVIDWYNFIVQHNPTPEGFQTGKGAAYVTPLRDKVHGRVYRVVYQDAKPPAIKSLDPKDGARLVAALKDDNLFWRMHAQRLLVERGKKDVEPDLIRLVSNPSTDAIGLNPAAIHALHTLQGLGVEDKVVMDLARGKVGEDYVDRYGRKLPARFLTAVSMNLHPALTKGLGHPSAGVRRNAVQVLPKNPSSVKAILDAGLLSDPDPQVRLAAYLALADQGASSQAATAIASALVKGEAEKDRWIGDALTAAAARNGEDFLKALAARKLDKAAPASVAQVAARVAEHYARGGPAESVGSVVVALGGADPAVAGAVVNGLVAGWPRDRPAKLSGAEDKAFVALLAGLPAGARGSLVTLGGRLGSKGLDTYSGEITGALLTTVRDPRAADAARSAAARQLIDFRSSDPEAAKSLLNLITPRTSPALSTGLLAAVSRSQSAGVAPALLKALPSLTPTARTEAVRALLGREDWASAFLAAVEAGSVRLDELSLDQKQALADHPNKALSRKARALLARGGGLPDADRQKVIDALAPAALRRGDAAKGKLVFTQQCAKCHRHGGEGGKVGPDLTGMAAHPKSELLTHILDPSRSVEGNYVAYTVATNDGRTFNGLLASETRTSVELIDTEGKTQKLLRDDIDELVASKKSLMPEGFEKQLPAESLADLLEFLTRRGKYMPLDLRKVATIDSTHGMFYARDGEAERLIFPDWSPKVFEGVPFSLVDPDGGKTPNVVLLYGPSGTQPPRMPRSVTLPCNAPVRALHLLSGVSGWGYNGGPRDNPTVSMIVRFHYAGGSTEDHPLRNGVEFADYIRRVDVPGSTFAFPLRGQQIRYLSVRPERADAVESIELVKGPDATAPVVMAATVELPES